MDQLKEFLESSTGEISSNLIGAYNRTFPCMEANYPYAIKNQRGASKYVGILRSKAPSMGLWMPKLVLYDIRLLAKQILGIVLDIEARGGPASLGLFWAGVLVTSVVVAVVVIVPGGHDGDLPLGLTHRTVVSVETVLPHPVVFSPLGVHVLPVLVDVVPQPQPELGLGHEPHVGPEGWGGARHVLREVAGGEHHGLHLQAVHGVGVSHAGHGLGGRLAGSLGLEAGRYHPVKEEEEEHDTLTLTVSYQQLVGAGCTQSPSANN